MKRHNSLLKRAVSAAENSIDNYRVGAVVARGNVCLSTGFNRGWKTHPLQAEMTPDRYYKGLHAEIDALRKLRKRTDSGWTIYVARIKKNGDWGMARPCNVCMRFLRKMGVTKVVYTHEDGYAIENIDL